MGTADGRRPGTYLVRCSAGSQGSALPRLGLAFDGGPGRGAATRAAEGQGKPCPHHREIGSQ